MSFLFGKRHFLKESFKRKLFFFFFKKRTFFIEKGGRRNFILKSISLEKYAKDLFFPKQLYFMATLKKRKVNEQKSAEK